MKAHQYSRPPASKNAKTYPLLYQVPASSRFVIQLLPEYPSPKGIACKHITFDIRGRLRRHAVDLPTASMGDDLEVIAGGSTGLIKLRADNSFVEKAPHPNDKTVEANLEDLRREYFAYQRLPRHPRVLQLHSDSTPQRLVLPYLRNGCLRDFLRDTSSSSSVADSFSSNSSSLSWSQRRLQFAADAAEALSILHSVQIIHGDINSWNFLLTDDFRLCIIDFSGSTIDGSAGSGFEGFRYCLPRSFHDPSTVRTDLFALGSLLYEIMTGETPYQSCEDQEVEEYFRKGIFPTTKDVPLLGRIMLGCWRGAYESAEAVYQDIRKQEEAV